MSYAANEVGELQWMDVRTNDLQLPKTADAPLREPVAGTTHQEAWAFIKTKEQRVHGSFIMPHGYKTGSDVIVHIDCASNSAVNGNVYWRFCYIIGAANTEFTAETPIYVEIPVQLLGENGRPKISHADFTTLSIPSLRMGQVIRWCLTRMSLDEKDTHEEAVLFFHLHAHVQIEYHGSRTIGAQ